jgi:hypothetical protein
VVQRLALRWVLAWLGLEDDGAVEREAALAREATCQAALKVLRAAPPGEAAAQRQTLGELRRGGVIGDDAFRRIEEEIDLLEFTGDPRIRCLEATPAAGAS